MELRIRVLYHPNVRQQKQKGFVIDVIFLLKIVRASQIKSTALFLLHDKRWLEETPLMQHKEKHAASAQVTSNVSEGSHDQVNINLLLRTAEISTGKDREGFQNFLRQTTFLEHLQLIFPSEDRGRKILESWLLESESKNSLGGWGY